MKTVFFRLELHVKVNFPNCAFNNMSKQEGIFRFFKEEIHLVKI